METNEMYQFKLQLIKVKNPDYNWAQRKTQHVMFSGLWNFLCQSFNIDKKKLTKEQKEEDVQEFVVEGTEEFCELTRIKVEAIEKKTINEFIEKSAQIRLLPTAVRRKMQEVKYNPDVTGFQWLCNVLSIVGILITVDVVKVE